MAEVMIVKRTAVFGRRPVGATYSAEVSEPGEVFAKLKRHYPAENPMEYEVATADDLYREILRLRKLCHEYVDNASALRAEVFDLKLEAQGRESVWVAAQRVADGFGNVTDLELAKRCLELKGVLEPHRRGEQGGDESVTTDSVARQTTDLR